jgi:hypothetical protein
MNTTKETDALYPRARYGDRDLEFFESHGYRKPVGPAVDGLWSYVSFSWIAPLIQKGKLRELNEGSATPFVPYRNDSAVLARQFDSMYAKLEVTNGSSARQYFLLSTVLSNAMYDVCGKCCICCITCDICCLACHQIDIDSPHPAVTANLGIKVVA